MTTSLDAGPWQVIYRPLDDANPNVEGENRAAVAVCLWNGQVMREMARVATTRKNSSQPRKKLDVVLEEERAKAQVVADTANALWDKAEGALAAYQTEYAKRVNGLADAAQAAVEKAEALAKDRQEIVAELEAAASEASERLNEMVEAARERARGEADAMATTQREYQEAINPETDTSLR